jgi:hypothetical protein
MKKKTVRRVTAKAVAKTASAEAGKKPRSVEESSSALVAEDQATVPSVTVQELFKDFPDIPAFLRRVKK